MPAKERLTKKEIEIDIKNSLKTPKEITEAKYKKETVIGTVFFILMLVLFFVNYRIALWVLLALFPIGLAVLVGEYLVRRRQSLSVRIEDYEIVKKPLSHVRLEKYERRERSGSRRMSTLRTVEIRFLCFEGYPDYQLPEENYRWSREYLLSDRFIYENAHRGEEFILAVNRSTGEIAAAYDADQFEYKEEKT